MLGRKKNETTAKTEETMARERGGNGASPDTVISIIGPGMRVVGDCDTDGTIRIDGHVEGTVRAGKAVVIGKDGTVDGDVETQDAVVSGRVTGTVHAASRLELQATCAIEGEIWARSLQLEEGAQLNGRVYMGDAVEEEPRALPASGESGGSDRHERQHEGGEHGTEAGALASDPALRGSGEV